MEFHAPASWFAALTLGLVEPEKTDHAEPEEILASVAEKEQKILDLIAEMQELVLEDNGK